MRGECPLIGDAAEITERGGRVVVITAYELRGKPLAAFRRRMRRRGQ